VILSWLTEPTDRGVCFASGRDGWDFLSYRELAAAAGGFAARLRRRGVGAGDVVCTAMDTGPDLLATFFGAWAAGATVTPVRPPSYEPASEYARRVDSVLASARPAATVIGRGQAHLLAGSAGGEIWEPDGSTAPVSLAPASPVAVLQFTSGSSGTPRGVRVSWDNIAANLGLLARHMGWEPGNSIASWVPLHHDMGFMATMLFPVTSQADLWLMQPTQFASNPARWLACFGPSLATHTYAPSFAFGYAARRVPADRLAALDMSGLRVASIGAEVVDPVALDRFARLAAPGGFSPSAFQFGYGLAEHTLIVTGSPPPIPPRIVRIDWAGLTVGAEVSVLDEMRIGDRPVSPGEGWVGGHGLPFAEVQLQIVDNEGREVPTGHLGQIVVRSPSVAQGYQHRDGFQPFHGTLATGDAGFIHGQDLFVLGRMGDSIKISARNVYMEDLDGKVAAEAGLSRDRVCVVGAVRGDGPQIVVFAEAKAGPWKERLAEFLRAELGPEPAITVVDGRRGLIKRTSSGKPRRRLMWEALLQSTDLLTICREIKDETEWLSS
jgi:fatty-acyl-CoA synthase